MPESWDVYLHEDATAPRSVLIDLGIAERAPVAALRHLGLVSVAMKQPRPDGLSSAEEADALYALDDRIVAAIVERERTVYVGRATGGGTRDLHFYTADPARFEEVARAALAGEDYEHAISVREDADWLAYFGELHPSPDELQAMMNRRVCDNLARQGDDGTRARPIDHFVYRLSEAGRDELTRRIEARGFVITDTRENGDGWVLCFVRSDAPEDIDAIVAELCELCREAGGDYDGWGCPCVAGEG